MNPLPFSIPKTATESFRVQEDRLPHFYDLLHCHPEVQLTAIVQSRGIFSIASQIGQFAEQEVYLIGTNVPHFFKNEKTWYEGNERQEAHAVSLFFREDSFGEKLFRLPEFQPVAQLLVAAQRGIRMQDSLAAEVGPKIREMTALTGAARIVRLLELLDRIAASGCWTCISGVAFGKLPKAEDFERLNAILQYLLENYREPVSLEDLAGIAHLSPSAFCRFFKQRTRKSFVEYLNEFRISMACRQLLDGNEPVAQICFENGFNNLANFNRQFRKIMGTTPSAYRKLHLSAGTGR